MSRADRVDHLFSAALVGSDVPQDAVRQDPVPAVLPNTCLLTATIGILNRDCSCKPRLTGDHVAAALMLGECDCGCWCAVASTSVQTFAPVAASKIRASV